ncbi:MAG: hypothetical protein QG640_1, partial [Patescibacteria group bacterium]|nr:hypothetical protein [Patescibacteria group bacterium]
PVGEALSIENLTNSIIVEVVGQFRWVSIVAVVPTYRLLSVIRVVRTAAIVNL